MSAISGFCEKCNKFRKQHCDGNRNTCMSILFDTIQTLQQENEQLQAQLDEWKYEAKCHMDEVVARDKEIEKLRAQVARMREVLEQFKYDYEQNCPLYQNYLYACQLLREDTGANYHNPADVEALRKAREALKGVNVVRCPYCWGKETHSDKCEISKAIETIDKAIGGKEDV